MTTMYTQQEIVEQILALESWECDLVMKHETVFDCRYDEMYSTPVPEGSDAQVISARINAFIQTHGITTPEARRVVNLEAARRVKAFHQGVIIPPLGRD